MLGSRTKIIADHGSWAAAGNITVSGISPEQLTAIVKAATDPLERLNAELLGTITQLACELGTSRELVFSFFRIIGEAGVAPAAVPERLFEIAAHYKQLRDRNRVDDLGNDPKAVQLKTDICTALEIADWKRADDLFAELEKHDTLKVAATRARRGELAITQLRYREAAVHFARAADCVYSTDDAKRIGFLSKEAEALYRQGLEFIDNTALREAAEIYCALLSLCPRHQVPLDWAATQNKLGIVLSVLGERESDTARLEEAIAAFNEARMEYTRDQVPLDWALTTTNLGNALVCLGEREEGTYQLKEAEASFREALELKDLLRDQGGDLAGIQANLGNALLRLGERESGIGALEEAVKVYREAVETCHEAFRKAFLEYARDPTQMKYYFKDRLKLQWATTKNGLGGAFRKLAAKESGTANLREAEKALRVALRIQKKERVPQQWAKTKNSLGATLRLLGDREHNRLFWDKAEHAYSDALDVYTPEAAPLQWAETKNNLGILFLHRGEHESDAKRLTQAVEAFKDALSIFDTDEAEVYKTKYTLHYNTFSTNLRVASSKLAWTRLSSSEGWLPDIIKGFFPR
jgi:tetratricopeptide (TPR) repeat protein